MTDQQQDFPDEMTDDRIAALEDEADRRRDELATTGPGDYIVHPLTGGAIATDAPTDQIAHALEEHAHVMAALSDYRHQLEAIVIARMDAANARTETVGDHKFTTNAPLTESYPVDVLYGVLQPLVDAGVLDPIVLERVIVTPPPKMPEPRADKREVNKLKKHPDERVRTAIEEACIEAPQSRTLKIERA